MKKKSEIKSGFGLLKEEKFIKVNDDWYPTYPNHLVRFKIAMHYFEDKPDYCFVRMCVWGADDFGLEKDFESTNYEELEAKYYEWKEKVFDTIPQTTNARYFEEKLGFWNA